MSKVALAAKPLHFLITAGPTREAIDPVRYLTNRSSGKMGYALAAAAVDRGHHVTLVSGPTALEIPPGADFVPVESADDMFQAVEARVATADVCIMAAAVADYRPGAPSDQKIKKTSGKLTLELVRTRDILGSARRQMGFGGLLVGFAAETENVESNAMDKLERKACDIVAANDVSRDDRGFDHDRNEIVLFFGDGRREPLGNHEKSHLGAVLIEICEREAVAT